MKTSLNEIRRAEKFLTCEMSEEEAVAYQDYLRDHPVSLWNFRIMKKVFSVLRLYRREQLQQSLNVIHDELFQAPEHESFRRTVLQYFKSE